MAGGDCQVRKLAHAEAPDVGSPGWNYGADWRYHVSFLDASIGLTVIFSGFTYLSRCMRDALQTAKVPCEMHTESVSDYATNLIN
jgi:hypothetical protein